MSEWAQTSRSSTNTSPSLTREMARNVSIEAGFADARLLALPHAAEARDAARFADWVHAGNASAMSYLERRSDDGQLSRSRVHVPFPWAQSALVCFATYDSAHPRSIDPTPAGRGWIARYAWTSRRDANGTRRPADYHKALLKRLRAIDSHLHAIFGEFESRAYVDTGPIVERALATAAGLGWTAKNTCLIHPKLGSYGFLAVLLTSLPVDDARSSIAPKALPQIVPDRCGTCTRCIDACPTHALDLPYRMDATRCIAYLTIEHKGPIAEELMPNIGRQVFGCDICQDVCPWNRKSRRSSSTVIDPELDPRPELVNPALEWLAALDEQSFEREFSGSPVRRAGFSGLRRNVAIAIGNSGLAQFVPALEVWAAATDDGLRAAARWALNRLRRGE